MFNKLRRFNDPLLFPKCHLMSQWNSSNTLSSWRRHVRCRSHDPSSLPHHLLVSTDVSPVGAITVVRGPDDAAWLHKTKRHPSAPVCCGVTVALMSRSWRDRGLVLLPPAETRHTISEAINYSLKYPGWSHRVGEYMPGFWESDTSIIHFSNILYHALLILPQWPVFSFTLVNLYFLAS